MMRGVTIVSNFLSLFFPSKLSFGIPVHCATMIELIFGSHLKTKMCVMPQFFLIESRRAEWGNGYFFITPPIEVTVHKYTQSCTHIGSTKSHASRRGSLSPIRNKDPRGGDRCRQMPMRTVAIIVGLLDICTDPAVLIND